MLVEGLIKLIISLIWRLYEFPTREVWDRQTPEVSDDE
jgi:hypothetical protein